jgi:predicted DNA-binding transcriptional regulator AlpA
VTPQVDHAVLAAHLDDLARIAQTVAEDLRNCLAASAQSEPHATVESRPDADGLLDIAAMTKLLVVNSRTLRRWRQMPGFPRPLKLDGPLRWRRSEIETWLARGKPK